MYSGKSSFHPSHAPPPQGMPHHPQATLGSGKPPPNQHPGNMIPLAGLPPGMHHGIAVNPSGYRGSGVHKPSVFDHCDRIKDEFKYLEAQCDALRAEIDTVVNEKNETHRLYVTYYDMAYQLNMEMHKQAEINKRFHSIIKTMISQLSPEQQQQYHEHVERAKVVPLSVIEEAVRSGAHAASAWQSKANGTGSSNDAKPISASDPNNPLRSLSIAASKEKEMGRNKSTERKFPQRKSPSTVDKFDTTKKQKTDRELSESNKEQEYYDSSSNKLGSKKLQRPMNSTTPPPSLMIPSKTSGLQEGSCFQLEEDGSYSLLPFNSNACKAPGLPKSVRFTTSFHHGDVVCSVALSDPVRHLYTGGKGCVKLWDINSKNSTEPLAELPCLRENYIRSCKILSDGRTLIVGGETNSLCVWDVAASSPRIKATFPSPSAACYALAISPASQLCFSCCNDGTINVWDIHNGVLVRTLEGHGDGVSCADITPDGSKLITGGLDNTVRVWDLVQHKEIAQQSFSAQVFALGICPSEPWLAVGLENSRTEVLDLATLRKAYQLHMHDHCVLSLKFAKSGKWCATTGKDEMVSLWRAPQGPRLFAQREKSYVLSCDVASDDSYLVAGLGDCSASVYQISY